jgi:D-glycero-D-manno-heptose 1,7-bisphosphate phosphatase
MTRISYRYHHFPAARGFVIAIVTNQSRIGRGYYSEADFLELMGWMCGEFMRHGVETYHCPDHPTHGIGRYRRDTPWRKPGPGMFLQVAADLSLDLARSWTIGDKPSDVAAGRAAGVGTLVLLDVAIRETRRDGDVWVVPSLSAARSCCIRPRRDEFSPLIRYRPAVRFLLPSIGADLEPIRQGVYRGERLGAAKHRALR